MPIIRLQRKEERMERLRDDPFYLTDDQPSAKALVKDDVDSIPVVHLDDLPPLQQSSGEYYIVCYSRENLKLMFLL